MLTVIFGREGCPYCVRAKDVAEKLANERDDFISTSLKKASAKQI